jgi:hypothetical protein
LFCTESFQRYGSPTTLLKMPAIALRPIVALYSLRFLPFDQGGISPRRPPGPRTVSAPVRPIVIMSGSLSAPPPAFGM